MALNLRASTRPLQQPKPRLGMTLAFKPAASEALADIPAHVIDIWPRFRSGDYLVRLEYAQPVKVWRRDHSAHRRIFQRTVSARRPQSRRPASTAQARLPAELLNSTPHITRGLAHQRFCSA